MQYIRGREELGWSPVGRSPEHFLVFFSLLPGLMLTFVGFAVLAATLHDVQWQLPYCNGGAGGYVDLSPSQSVQVQTPPECANRNLTCALGADGLSLSAHGVYNGKAWKAAAVSSGCSRNEDDAAACCMPTDSFKCLPAFNRCVDTGETGLAYKYDCEKKCQQQNE